MIRVAGSPPGIAKHLGALHFVRPRGYLDSGFQVGMGTFKYATVLYITMCGAVEFPCRGDSGKGDGRTGT